MSDSRTTDDKSDFLEIRSSKDYYKISNFLNYNTDTAFPQKLSNNKGNVTLVEVSTLSDVSSFLAHDKLMAVFSKAQSEDFVTNIVVHGSFGDLTSNNYSDVDMTLILDDNIFNSSNKLIKLQNWLRNDLLPVVITVDPLQHHGPFFLWPNLIENYTEEILPIDVYQNAWAMEPITLSFSSQSSDKRGNKAYRALKNLQDDSKFFHRGYTMYNIKRYLSNLMLVPALYWSDLGKPIFKADSFEPFYKKFGSAADPIKVASVIRQKWPLTPEKTFKATQLGSRVKGGLEVARQLYHDESITDILVNQVIPGISDLVDIIERN